MLVGFLRGAIRGAGGDEGELTRLILSGPLRAWKQLKHQKRSRRIVDLLRGFVLGFRNSSEASNDQPGTGNRNVLAGKSGLCIAVQRS